MAVVGLQPFIASLQAFTVAMRKDFDAYRKIITLDALQQLISRTPVESGNARFNWQITVGNPATGTLSYNKDQVIWADKTNVPSLEVGGLIPLGRETPEITRASPNETIFITNNVDYIKRLEDGSSHQAPAGMLAVTVESLVTKYPDLVRI